MPTPADVTMYATDENVAERAAGDFAVLAPKHQSLSAGIDGVIAAGVPWVLTSAAVGNFAARGIAAGHVVSLSTPRTRFPGEGWLYAVDSVATTNLALRGIGLDSGDGEPPGPAAGLTGVTFNVPTVRPQIRRASLHCNQVFGIDPNKVGRKPGDAYDPNDDLTQFVVLTVLIWLYTSETRSERGDWALKAKLYREELEALKARMSVYWGPTGEDDAPSNRFSTTTYR